MKRLIFRGVGTALITPHRRGRIDYPRLEDLIERQIASGIGALIIGGTTGEAATLGDSERRELYRRARALTEGRCALILGAGTNDTRTTKARCAEAEKIGCDGVLLVTPYYNKGTREGVIRHYREAAKSTSLPIILYNVPPRTGVDLDPESVERLAECDNIVGIKEASGKVGRLAELAAVCARCALALYAGNDADTLAAIRLGGMGVISVLSNLCPGQMSKMAALELSGDSEGASAAEAELLPLMKAMFLETNPAPIKYALSRLGLCFGEMRLPMWEVGEETKRKIDEVMRESGLLMPE